jgi:hypothetical protein
LRPKLDFETGRPLDLDKTYKGIIKDAVTDAGLECIRADEIKHSGLIDVPTCDFSVRPQHAAFRWQISISQSLAGLFCDGHHRQRWPNL